MGIKILNQLEAYEWIGRFSYPGGSYTFAGKLKYSPASGVQLEYVADFDQAVSSTTHLHGILKDGQPCTLVGDFNPADGGMTFGDVAATYQGIYNFAYVIFGIHMTPDDKFKGIRVNFSSFQEFCYPQGFKNDAPLILQPAEKYDGQEFEVSIVNEGSFKCAQNIVNQLHINDESLKGEIEAFFTSVKEKYPKSAIMLRQNIRWFLKIISKGGLTIKELIKTVWSFNKLFSLLMFYPTKPIELKVIAENSKGLTQSKNILIHISEISSRALRLLENESSHYNLSITPKKVNIYNVIEKWVDVKGGYDLFALKISNDYGHYYDYELHAELVLILAQIEQIAAEDNKLQEKYIYPIRKYDLSNLEKIVRDILNLDKEIKKDIGVVLSELRGEIVHVGRPRKHLVRMPTQNIMELCRCLDILIASYIYENLDIPKEIIKDFQDKNLNDLLMQFSES